MDEVPASAGTPAGAVEPEHDELILVDAHDERLGTLSKARCHEGQGVLHRAFSLLIFNDAGELLIQQRAAGKRLWPLYWSNSVCSHPRGTETLEQATRRRLLEELGLACALQFLFKFQYQAQFDATGAENELCSVYIGRSAGALQVNPQEIADFRWIAPRELQAAMDGAAGLTFTPWFRLEWARIWRDYRAEITSLQYGLS